jgi:hypothetical protein
MRPRDADGLAAGARHHWMFGANAVLLGVAADPALFAQLLAEAARHWAMALPGTELSKCAR